MPPILLIPGNMCDQRLWRPVGDRLAEAGHAVVHARRLSQSSIGSMADAVCSDLGSRTVLVGFSMGAIVAAEVARRAPGKVAALSLVAFNASADLIERAAVRPRQQQAVRGGQLEAIVARELKPNYLAEANRGNTKLLRTVMAMARTLGPDVFVAQSEALRLREDLRPSLSALEMPVLLACGSEDRLCPREWHRRWAAMIGVNAWVAEIPGAGHLVPLEQPNTLSAALIGWLAEEAQCQTVS